MGLFCFRSNVWAVCPTGYFLRGINVRDFAGSGGADPNYLDDITHGRCCRPKHHPNEYGSCYDEDIWSSFDSAGWASCKESFFMTGFYKSNCNFLYCMEELRCCSMTTIQGKHCLTYHVTSCHVTLRYIRYTSCHVMSRFLTLRYVLPCHVMTGYVVRLGSVYWTVLNPTLPSCA